MQHFSDQTRHRPMLFLSNQITLLTLSTTLVYIFILEPQEYVNKARYNCAHFSSLVIDRVPSSDKLRKFLTEKLRPGEMLSGSFDRKQVSCRHRSTLLLTITAAAAAAASASSFTANLNEASRTSRPERSAIRRPPLLHTLPSRGHNAQRKHFTVGCVRATTGKAAAEEASRPQDMLDPRILESPSADRNKGPIWDVISSRVVPSLLPTPAGRPLTVVEVAAGCGVHALHFVGEILGGRVGGGGSGYPHSPAVDWYPTDPDARSRASIDARSETAPDRSIGDSVRPAASLTLDEMGVIEGRRAAGGGGNGDPTQGLTGGVDLMTCINMIHISPWTASVGLMKVASELLRTGGVLYCYGPYKVGGMAAQSNL